MAKDISFKDYLLIKRIENGLTMEHFLVKLRWPEGSYYYKVKKPDKLSTRDCERISKALKIPLIEIVERTLQ